ncbi:MAG: barstar family protein [Acidobacteriaceae bacterium]|nr:barstar family protein [Acidobacteriaceae bacterium]MBV9224115.1 barstar family protein [Acidobacteriaceae bacterium]MBV9306604.1 barstar family protein [Acidobacteriaceae bacterium]MBV9674849.1 barstar family protein [Acidobacteriaceae bacterium]MBV9940473.1 barstar family protein [Acidobacteriaceae bacterium]
MAGLIKGIQVIGATSIANDIQDAVSREGIYVWRINLSGVTSKAGLMNAIGKALSFPDYYSCNWDSLEEFLRDFNEGEGWLIVFDQADNLLALPRQDLATLESILSDTANFWSAEGRIFGVLFVGSPSFSDALSLAPAR